MELHASGHELTTCIECLSRSIGSFLRDEHAVTAIEYALLAALIVIAASGSIVGLGGGVDGMWAQVSAMVSATIGRAL